MAFFQDEQYITAPAGVDLSSAENKIVKIDSNGNAVFAADDGIGFVYEGATVGNPVTIRIEGVGKVIAGGVISSGDRITSDGTGNAVVATPATANTTTGAITGSKSIAIAFQDASAAGEVISAFITHAGLTA